MACIRPIPAWQAPGRKTTIKASEGYQDLRRFFLPCGTCDYCLKNRSRSNVVRMVHHLEEHNGIGSFITLTYDNAHLPPEGNLSYRDVQLFFKLLRRRGFKFSYFVAGEYGENLGRPHYHICFFGYRPENIVSNTCAEIFECWSNGSHDIQDLTLGSISYVAQYVMKKSYGSAAPEHYKGKVPEFCRWSKGIGKSWWFKYGSDLLIDDSAILDGHKVSVPSYYDKMLKKYAPDTFEDIKRQRVAKAFVSQLRDGRDELERLRVAERVSFHKTLTKRKRGSYESI